MVKLKKGISLFVIVLIIVGITITFQWLTKWSHKFSHEKKVIVGKLRTELGC